MDVINSITVEKVETQSESPVEFETVDLRRCTCPVCNSRDVWKWGRPTLTDRLVQSLFDRTAITCRRCGHKFRRKVVFGHS